MKYVQRKIYSDYANVHAVCQQALAISDPAGIESILIGGSLLGMIRDGDFLPWDKDVDFAVFAECIPKVVGLETQFRQHGFECRVHHVGVRNRQQLDIGLELLIDLAAFLDRIELAYCVIGGALLNLVRDQQLHPETDTLSLIISQPNPQQISQLQQFNNDANVYFSHHQQQIKSVCISQLDWRINLFCETQFNDGFGWRDLNCEYSFNQSLLLDCASLEIGGYRLKIPNNCHSVLDERYGQNWRLPNPAKFDSGRLMAFFQVYKDGVMVDYIAHYDCGEKTYWFEPTANMISTKGFKPANMQTTKAGQMLIPSYAEIFLEEHYGDWRTPVKSWNGAVDNPTLIDPRTAFIAIQETR